MKGKEIVKPVIIIMVMAGLAGCHKRKANPQVPAIKVGKFFIVDREDHKGERSNSSCMFYVDIKAITPIRKMFKTKIRACGPKGCSKWQNFVLLPYLDKGQTFSPPGDIDHCPDKVTRFEVKVLKEYLNVPWDNKYVHAKVLSWSKHDKRDDICVIKIKAGIDHLTNGYIDVVARDKEGRPRTKNIIQISEKKTGKPVNLSTEILVPCKTINSITLQLPE